jgi:small-conductance mechanosensitive channel/CRP-like cAMP-binding protein
MMWGDSSVWQRVTGAIPGHSAEALDVPLRALLEPYFVAAESHFWIQGTLALVAALFAIALRRQKRLFKPPGFIMLALGLSLDLMSPRGGSYPELTAYWRAVALTLVLFGVLRLIVESFVVTARGRKADLSTLVPEVILAVLYGATILVIFRFMLGISPRVLLAVPAIGTLTWGWIRQGNFFSGLLLQYRHPFEPGDWVRVGNYVGRVVGGGWRATRVRTRANEIVQVPNNLLATQLLINYSPDGPIADELFIGLAYDVAPDRVEQTIQTLLKDIPEVRKSEVDIWEYGESAIRYRIRFWVSDYAIQEQVRIRITRSVWYALHRNSIEIAYPTRRIVEEQPRAALQPPPAQTSRDLIPELRRVYLLNALSEEELALLIPTIRVRHYGRGEALIRQGEIGDCFYVLRHGKVEVTATGPDGVKNKHIKYIEDSSPESFLGEIALLTAEPRNATCRAVTDVEVLEITREGFTRLFQSKPEAGKTVAGVAARRIAETSARVAEADVHAANGRSANRILTVMRKVFDF